MKTIHFVCRGNALRSLTAEIFFNSLELNNITAISSGTVAEEFRERNKPTILRTLTRLEGKGIDSKYFKKRADQLTQDRIADDQILVCMNQIVFDEVNAIVIVPENTIVWDIVDVGEGKRMPQTPDDVAVFEDMVYEEIATRIKALAQLLKD